MECHPWLEVSDRRKIRFRNVQIKVLLVFEQGRPLQVSTSFDNFDQFQPVLTSFDQFRPVLTSLDWFISHLITSKIQYFWGGSLLLPTSVLLLCQHDHCESNAFIVVDHHDQWPWLESLLSTNMLFSVCFPWPYSIYTYIWHFPGS